MKIGIITIGNELLNGMRIDTNSSWIGESVQPAGGNVVLKASVVDDKNQIIHVLNSISDDIKIIIVDNSKDEEFKKNIEKEYKNILK